MSFPLSCLFVFLRFISVLACVDFAYNNNGCDIQIDVETELKREIFKLKKHPLCPGATL